MHQCINIMHQDAEEKLVAALAVDMCKGNYRLLSWSSNRKNLKYSLKIQFEIQNYCELFEPAFIRRTLYKTKMAIIALASATGEKKKKKKKKKKKPGPRRGRRPRRRLVLRRRRPKASDDSAEHRRPPGKKFSKKLKNLPALLYTIV